MDNYLLLKESTELLELSKKLGFSKTYFLDSSLILVKGGSKKQLLKEINQSKGLTIYT